MTQEEWNSLKVGDVLQAFRFKDMKGPIIRVRTGAGREKYFTVSDGLGQWTATDPEFWSIVSRAEESAEPGTHYKATPIEVWEAIEAWQSSWPPEIRYHVGSAIKYLGRLGRKEGAPVDSDLKKAVAFLERALKVYVGK